MGYVTLRTISYHNLQIGFGFWRGAPKSRHNFCTDESRCIRCNAFTYACTHYIQLFHQSFYHSFLHSSINSFMHSYIYSFLSSCVVSVNRIDKGSTFRPDAAALRGCDLGRGLRTSMGSPEDTMGKWINHGDFEGFYGVLRYFKHQNHWARRTCWMLISGGAPFSPKTLRKSLHHGASILPCALNPKRSNAERFLWSHRHRGSNKKRFCYVSFPLEKVSEELLIHMNLCS